MVGEKELQLLSEIILRNLKQEFETKHLSRNLINTIQVVGTGDEINIHIPAQTYNMLLYQHKGVVVHTGHGSYASKLDEEGSSFRIYPGESKSGSFTINPGNHKGYINKIVDASIEEWKGMLGKGKVQKVEG